MEKKRKGDKSGADRRVVVSIRNVSEARWKAVKEKADQQGRKMRAVIDEMMDEWLSRH